VSATLKQLRKLVLGETWTLPLGVLCTLGAIGIYRLLDDDDTWWQHAGGFILLGLVALALTASLAGALRAHRR
jgi:hypothetical protein